MFNDGNADVQNGAPDKVVHEEDGWWFFYDETWSDRWGPFPSKDNARTACGFYCRKFLGIDEAAGETQPTDEEFSAAMSTLSCMPHEKRHCAKHGPRPFYLKTKGGVVDWVCGRCACDGKGETSRLSEAKKEVL